MVQFEHTKSTHTTVHEEVVHGPSVSGVGTNATGDALKSSAINVNEAAFDVSKEYPSSWQGND